MRFFKLLGSLSLVVLAGCTAIMPVTSQYSGFLENYSNLVEVKAADGSDAMRWVNPDIQKGAYQKVFVPPVTFYPAPVAGEQVSHETLQQISTYLTERVRQELGKHFAVVNAPGPGTLKFRIAITGVDTPIQGLRFYEINPVALAFTSATVAAGERDHVTVVYVEGVATDSQTGVELAKGVRQGLGKPLENKEQQLRLERVRPMLDVWAKEMGELANRLL